jgi:DNA-binding transcriptional regulator YhcF (GntR family)
MARADRQIRTTQMATETPLKNSTRGSRKSAATNTTSVATLPAVEEATSAEAAEAGRGKLRRPSGLVEDAYARIREDIMSLKVPPNTRISVDSLARELGVSQTPIREALSMLEAHGLVTKQRFIGYCTAPTLNRKQFEELFEVRLLVEPYAARRAAEKMSDKALIELSGLALQKNPTEANRSLGCTFICTSSACVSTAR